jgi:transposase
VDTIPVTARADLTDGQWAVLERLLPKGRKPGRPPKWSKRQLIDGIRWRGRVGAPWRDVPARYRPWATVYGLYGGGSGMEPRRGSSPGCRLLRMRPG